MKNRGFFSWRIWLPILIGLTVCLLVAARKRHQILYPYSPELISATGRPIPDMKSWLSSHSSESSDKSTLTINAGKTIKEGDEYVLDDLSPIIRAYPNTRRFVYYWDTSLLGTQYCYKVTYDRSAKTFAEDTGCDASTSKVLGRNLTDLDIHNAVATGKSHQSYRDWAYKHWKQ